MIRFLLDAIWVVVFLILSLPLLLIEVIIGLFNKKLKARSSQVIIAFAFRVVSLIAGTRIIVKGQENIPKDEAVLYVPNHRGIFDIVITYPLYINQTAFVAKQETKKFPVFSIWMAFMNCQFLDRKDLRKGLKVILKCADLIKEGVSVVIFPEGTRNKTEEPLQEFHDGSFKIAEKSECKIIPVAINNTDQIFEAQLPKVRKHTVIVEYCKPIETKGLQREEKKQLSEKVKAEILEAYLRNKELEK